MLCSRRGVPLLGRILAGGRTAASVRTMLPERRERVRAPRDGENRSRNSGGAAAATATAEKTDAARRSPGASNGNAGGNSLYDVLGVAKNATVAEIRRAYRTLALATHPDKSAAPDAAEKFQQLQRVYEVLSDEQRRTVYDETGVVTGADGEDDSLSAFFTGGFDAQQLYDYFRQMYAKVTVEDIQKYEEKYRYGQPERDDLRDMFVRFRGRVNNVLSYIPYSDESDVARFVEYFDAMSAEELDDNERVRYKKSREALLRRAKRVTRREEQAKVSPDDHGEEGRVGAETQRGGARRHRPEASALAKGGTDDLAAAILARRGDHAAQMDELADRLAVKYAPKAKRSRSSGASSKQPARPPSKKS